MKFNIRNITRQIVTLITFFAFSFNGVSQNNPEFFQGLILEQLNNNGEVDGTTYRLYAEISSGQLIAIWANENNPLALETTTSFYNESTVGGNFQSDINTALYTSFSGVNGEVSGLLLEEQNIYKEMYLYDYYTKQTRNTIRGIADDTNGNILSVRDGDNAITFVNKNEVSKVYKGLAQDSYNALEGLIGKYNSYQASPRQVGGIESRPLTTGTN